MPPIAAGIVNRAYSGARTVVEAIGRRRIARNRTIDHLSSGALNIYRSSLILPTVVLAFLGSLFLAPRTYSQKDGSGEQFIGRFTAVEIKKPTGSASALDIHLDGTGKALRIFAPGSKTAGTYFHDTGMLHTSGWVVISGTASPTGDIQLPTKDPSMLAVWSDVHGPAIQVRSAPAGPESYILQALDREGDYAFSVEQNGGLRWGEASRAEMDTNLYRSKPMTLKTDGSLVVDGKVGIGSPGPASALHVGGSQSVRRTAVRANYVVTDADYYLGVTDTSAQLTVTLPSAAGREGRVYVVKDESGGAGRHPIIMKALPGETIDGAQSLPIGTNYGVLRVISSGEGWFGM